MRMKDLVEATGMPRTAIHHYQREGLLPAAVKTAANAAVYGPEHVERLGLIRALRGNEMGPLPLGGVRQVLDMVDRGVEPEVAVALHALPRGVGAAESDASAKVERTLSDVARGAGLSLSVARDLHKSGLLVGRPGEGEARVFDEADAIAAGLIADLLGGEGVRPADLDPIAELMGELVRYERALTGLAIAGLDSEQAAERRHVMYRGLHALHTYLYSRTLPGGDARLT